MVQEWQVHQCGTKPCIQILAKPKLWIQLDAKIVIAKPIFEIQPCFFFLQNCEGLKGGGGTDIQGFKQFMFNITYQTFHFYIWILFVGFPKWWNLPINVTIELVS